MNRIRIAARNCRGVDIGPPDRAIHLHEPSDDRFGRKPMIRENPPPPSAPSCLVRVHQESDGSFTAQLLGAADLQATGATRDEAVERLRARLQELVNLDELLAIELPRQNPLVRRAGYLKDDPDFNIYLEEIRKFREEMDRREAENSEPAECSDTSLTPTT
jgi:hypothetical protein